MKIQIKTPDGKNGCAFECDKPKDIKAFYDFDTLQDMVDAGYPVLADGAKVTKKQLKEWSKA